LLLTALLTTLLAVAGAVEVMLAVPIVTVLVKRLVLVIGEAALEDTSLEEEAATELLAAPELQEDDAVG
jgi:hypothetical protein